MSKLHELKSRHDELVLKISELWDELIEVDENIWVTEETIKGKKPQNEQQQSKVNLREMEVNLRDAALRRASIIFSQTISNLEETRPECPKCGEIMKKKKIALNK